MRRIEPYWQGTGAVFHGLVAECCGQCAGGCGLRATDIDGLTTGYQPPANVAQLLGIRPDWVDSTVVGGCSWMMQLRNAMAAIAAGYCHTVLITHGESGRSHVIPNVYDIGAPGSIEQQFDLPYAGTRAALFALSLLRYMKESGVTEEQIAAVAVAQRKWAALNPRATLRDPVTVTDILGSPNICWPLRRAMCCLVSDAGGAIVVCSADRAAHFPKRPVYILGTGSAIETGVSSPAGVGNPVRPELISRSGKQAFASARLSTTDVDHLMIYDAFAHLPILALEGLGFVEYGAAGAFVAEGNTEPEGGSPSIPTEAGCAMPTPDRTECCACRSRYGSCVVKPQRRSTGSRRRSRMVGVDSGRLAQRSFSPMSCRFS